MSKSYKVGYGKPPKSGQFKPGESGNPKGKPKGKKNLKTELKEEIFEKVVIKEGGKAIKVSKQRAIIKAMAAKAAHGDTKAASVLINLVLKLLNESDDVVETMDLLAEDKAILENFKATVLADASALVPGKSKPKGKRK